jgi:hypothetical protein
MRLLLCCGAGWELFESLVLVMRISHDSDLRRNSPVGTLLKIYDNNTLKIDYIQMIYYIYDYYI